MGAPTQVWRYSNKDESDTTFRQLRFVLGMCCYVSTCKSSDSTCNLCYYMVYYRSYRGHGCGGDSSTTVVVVPIFAAVLLCYNLERTQAALTRSGPAQHYVAIRLRDGFTEMKVPSFYLHPQSCICDLMIKLFVFLLCSENVYTAHCKCVCVRVYVRVCTCVCSLYVFYVCVSTWLYVIHCMHAIFVCIILFLLPLVC